jgi:hypothetical protein
MNILKFLIPGLLAIALSYGLIFIFTQKGSKVRAWVLATPNRIGAVGVTALILLWCCIVAFNRLFGGTGAA